MSSDFLKTTVGNWGRLTRFLDDPRIPLDNSVATERGIRGPVSSFSSCSSSGAPGSGEPGPA
jgi:hypothetical protein